MRPGTTLGVAGRRKKLLKKERWMFRVLRRCWHLEICDKVR
jgi:hypothetical protein